MNELEKISIHFHDKLKSLKQMLDQSVSELPQSKVKKLGQDLLALDRLLDEFETCVGQQKEQLKDIKELEEIFQKSLEDVQHLKDNIPAHMPMKKLLENVCEPALEQIEAAGNKPAELENVKKSNKSFVRDITPITISEFESIPQYIKGRVSYDQVNAVVQSINTAVKAKYKILHQPVKSLNSQSWKLKQRFKDQETKDTKGQYFVVEDDIRELTRMKVDKRFQGILNMLRHCQRLREIRGGGVTRYALLEMNKTMG